MTKRFSGQWVWNELMTTNPSNSSEYYRSLYGWTGQEMDMGEMGKYMMFQKGDDTVGGMMKVPMEGIPSHWLGYIGVDDIAAAEKKITELGGTVLQPTFDIPDGKCLVAKDPDGAVFGLWNGKEGDKDFSKRPPVGTVCWHEHMTRNLDAVVKFYGELVGWTTEPMGEATVFKMGEAMLGTVRALPAEAPAEMPSHWMTYIAVDDIDDTVKKATDLGGNTMMGKTVIPNMGEFAVLTDPTGAVYSAWKNTGA